MATVPSSVLEGRWKNMSLSQTAALCSLTCCCLCVVWGFLFAWFLFGGGTLLKNFLVYKAEFGRQVTV